MNEDREALDRLYESMRVLIPAGPRQEIWLNQLRRMAAISRCPQWQPQVPKPQLTLCRPPS